MAVAGGVLIYFASCFTSVAQYVKSTLAQPPATMASTEQKKDSVDLRFQVQPTIPGSYDQLRQGEHSIDLKTPKNIVSETEFDPTTGCYIVRTKIGDQEIVTPFILTPDEYTDIVYRQSMQEYYRQKNSETEEEKKKKPFNFLDMQFGLGPLEKVFGPGGVQLKTQGSIQINMGVKTNRTDNPALSVSARKKTYFDFDQKIQATINASVGDKLKFNMTYNTGATFDFDTKNLKLAYEGKEDEIIKEIEAGNVSMTTGSSLIKGSASLFGFKTKLQFGKLTATALVSQQNSQSQTVNTKGGVQTTAFRVGADEYDQNRHFFLAHWFRDNYDNFTSSLPLSKSGINITRIEVWITNKRGKYDDARNLMAFADLAEGDHIMNQFWTKDPQQITPTSRSNTLYSFITTNYPDARYINQAATVLEPLAESIGFHGGRDYEKVESARLLSSNEYVLNTTLGYISLKTALNADEVLGVAYQYTYAGRTYQVGEFSTDITDSNQSIYVKMLKATTVSNKVPMWHLMMKNVYSLGAYSLQRSNFKLNIKYLSDTTGTEINFLPAGPLSKVPLLQVMNLDRLDSNNQTNPDGYFDYIEGYTVDSNTGRVYFPVVEPFGSHLAKKVGPVWAKDFVYQELYDSTITIARQYQEKNKFVLMGEYQASSGSQIRLNATNVPRGSVVVTAGGVTLTENSDYTVDYSMGIVTITNQSIIDAGTNVSVTLENQQMYSTQRKTLLGLDLNYQFSKNLNLGATIMHYGEKALTEKVSIGNELVNNTIWGLNLSWNTEFMWLTNLFNKIPTVNATRPSTLSFTGEFAQLIPHQQPSGSNRGSSYIDDFESTQSAYDLRSPYSWFLASTPYDPSSSALFPEAELSNDVRYGKNRALLAWYNIDRLFTQRNSSLCPGYIKSDLEQLSYPYVREITYDEVFPGRDLSYGESNVIQTLNLSYYPTERGPYNLDTNVNDDGTLQQPEARWGGIMRKLDNTNFEQSNIEYIQFWLLNPFLDEEAPNKEGGELYFNLGEISEDILKDGQKSYENGLPINGEETHVKRTVWGKVSSLNSVSYAFDTSAGSRIRQDVGLNGLSTTEELNDSVYRSYVTELRTKLSPTTIAEMEVDKFSPLNDPAGDNYHFYRGYDYDEQRLSILQRYKRYNGTEGNSLSVDDASDALYQSSRSVPDVEDVNQDNTLNEYERYFQYRVKIHPDSLVVGRNFITDKIETTKTTRDGKQQRVEWYQFSIPLRSYQKAVGSISDFSTIRFMRMFLTNFKATTHLRFATLELIRGEWRDYRYNLDSRVNIPAEGEAAVTKVNIEENAGRVPVNYVLPPGVTRIVDSGQSQVTQLNEQSLQIKMTDLPSGETHGVYRNTSIDLRIYKRLQMFVHQEALVDDYRHLQDGDMAVIIRLGTDVKNNYYEYEIPLTITPPGKYSTNSTSDRLIVWPEENMLDCDLDVFTTVKRNRNQQKAQGVPGVGFTHRFSEHDPEKPQNTVTVMGNPSLGDVRVVVVGVRNKSHATKDCIIWVDELRVTDFDNSGGWAAKANLTLGISDIATVNAGYHHETVGFGSVDQSLSNRRMDAYNRINVAVQADMGRFLPEKAKLKAPIYYSYSNETTSPKYNPLDQDELLKDVLDDCTTKAQKDSINAYAVTRNTVESFSLSGVKFDVKSKKPMPWDPANFTVSYSSNVRHKNDPNTEFETSKDYRGSFQYSYAPYYKPFAPFKKMKSKSKNAKFLKEWEFNWLPQQITFLTNISRNYYEQKDRNEVDVQVELPVQVSKNFLWDRQLSLTWNLTKTLMMSFNSNTTAHIEEPMGRVNKQLMPDEYRDWRDSVWHSIKHLGTPYNYNQTFNASYKAPFSKIAFLDFLTANASYNATYNWDHGTVVDSVSSGNTIRNQAAWNIDGRFDFEKLYNKAKYLSDINKRFANQRSTATTGAKKAKKFQRTYKLQPDTTFGIKHNMRTRKVKVTATTTDGKPIAIKSRIIDDNSVEILEKGNKNVRIIINEVIKEHKSFWSELSQYALRFAMLTRSVSVRYRNTKSWHIPQFIPQIGDIFGQTKNYGNMFAPGLDFAFGFVNESYLDKAMNNGWLMCDQNQTSPAIHSRTEEFHMEVNLEPIRGLKITLTGNRTDNRTTQMQFMFDDMVPTYSGSYTKTHLALATALRGYNSKDGYNSQAFNAFLDNIPIVAQRLQSQYEMTSYPTNGFFKDRPEAGTPFDSKKTPINQRGSDVLIPAFLAAYSGRDASKIDLNPFPGIGAILPNWKLTYDGLSRIQAIKKYFKSFTLTHAYQCTYSVGSFTSYSDWVGVNKGMGFTQDGASGNAVPTSPYNITTATVTEKFAPLIGINATMNNNITFNVEYRDSRTLSLSATAAQIVESSQRGLQVGAGYKIANFNSILKIRGRQQGVSNDLTLNLNFQLNSTTALIRKIETKLTQATSGARTLALNFSANYVLSKRITLGAYFDHQMNTPLVSTSSYPTSNSNYGISINMSLAR